MVAFLSLVVAGLVGSFAEEGLEPGQADERRLGGRSNPFRDQKFYVNPSYRSISSNAAYRLLILAFFGHDGKASCCRTSLASSIASSDGHIRATLESALNVPSAYWLDKRGHLG